MFWNLGNNSWFAAGSVASFSLIFILNIDDVPFPQDLEHFYTFWKGSSGTACLLSIFFQLALIISKYIGGGDSTSTLQWV